MAETIKPIFDSANVLNTGLTVYVGLIEADSPPVLPASAVTGFALKVNGTPRSLSAAIRHDALTFALTPASVIYIGETVTVEYSPGNVADSLANAMDAFTAQPVSNGSTVQPPDTTRPVLLSAGIGNAGNPITLNFTETGSQPLIPATSITGFSCTVNGVTRSIVFAAIDDNDPVAVILTLDSVVYPGQTVLISYAPGNLTDSSNNGLLAFSGHSVINLSQVPVPNTAAGRYADSGDLDDLRGSLNITAWSDLNNTGNRDTNRIQRAFDQTDPIIEKALEHLYTIPLAVTGNDAQIVNGWSTVLASFWLYENRGQYDQSDNGTAQAGNLYQTARKSVMAEIDKYRDGQRYRLNAARRNSDNTSTPTGPAMIRNPIGPYNPRYLDHEHNR